MTTKQTDFDFKTFAVALGEALGGFKLNPTDSFWQAELTVSDDLMLHVSGYQQHSDRPAKANVSAYSTLSRDLREDERRRLRWPEATVQVDRPMDAIAKDITRRVLEPGKANLEAVKASATANRNEKAAALAKIEAFKARYPHARLTAKEDPIYGAEVYINGNTGLYMTGTLSTSGEFNTSGGRLSMTAEFFDAVMAVLAEKVGK